MGRLAEWIKEREIELDEDNFVSLLDVLAPRSSAPAASLSDADRQYLERFSDVKPASRAQTTALERARIADAASEIVCSLSRAQVAERLGVSTSRISHRQADGHLYALRAAPGRHVFPDWQFGPGATTLPFLPDVLAALPKGAPPSLVRHFMTSADPDLIGADGPMSPRDWLLAGGNADMAVALARTLGDRAA